MNIKGQGHSLTFIQGHSDSPKTTLGQLKPNFVLSLHRILGWKFVQMFRVTWPRWLPGSYMVKIWKKKSSSEPRSRWSWNLVYSFGYSSTIKFLQMKTLGWPCPFLWHGQICFMMLLHGWKLIQHIVIYFEGYSNSAYPMHSGERYRTVCSSGLYVFQLLRQCFNTLLKNLLPILVEKYIGVVSPDIKLNTNVFSFLVSCFN